MADQPPNHCINCRATGIGNYCSNCGQKLHTQKITWKYAFSDFIDRWLGMDTKYGRTVVGLFKNPDNLITTYLHGNNVKYIGPLGYYVVMTALMLLLLEFLGISMAEFMEASNESMGMTPEQTSEEQKAFQSGVMGWISDHFRLFSGLMIPFTALAGKMYYRKSSYLHHIIRFTYIQAHTIWVTITIIIVYSITGELYSLIMLSTSSVYISWALMKCYPQKYKAWGFVKGLIAWVTGYVIFFLFVAIIMLIGLFIMAYIG